MKIYLPFLMLALSLMFAPFVFAVDIGQSVSEMPVFSVPVIDVIQPEVGAHCRDVLDEQKIAFVYTHIGRMASPYGTYKTQTWKGAGNIMTGITGIFNHREGDSYQTDRTV